MIVRGYAFFNVHANYKLSLFLFLDQLKFLFLDINLWQAANQSKPYIYKNLPNDHLEKLYVILW